MKRILPLFWIFTVLIACVPTPIDPAPSTAEPVERQSACRDSTLPDNAVQGQVVDAQGGPIGDAVVRLQATQNSTISDPQGCFRLDDVGLEETRSITAWKEGYFINLGPATKDEPFIRIVLEEIASTDNRQYAWLSSINADGEGENQGCAECHAATEAEPIEMLPVDEWLADAHSQSAVNPRFLSIYNGTDMQGHQSPQTKFIPSSPSSKNNAGYSYVALPPDDTLPYYGPGVLRQKKMLL